MFTKSSITLFVVMALGASARAQYQTQVPADAGNPTPTYRINVVSRTTRAVSYRHRSGSTKINFQGTDLMPGAAKLLERRITSTDHISRHAYDTGQLRERQSPASIKDLPRSG